MVILIALKLCCFYNILNTQMGVRFGSVSASPDLNYTGLYIASKKVSLILDRTSKEVGLIYL